VKRAVYLAPAVLFVLAAAATWASPAELICGGAATCPADPPDPTWVTYAAYVLWALTMVALVLAALVAAYRGVRGFLALSRTPAEPPERHDLIS
jgi:hypothetical protein